MVTHITVFRLGVFVDPRMLHTFKCTKCRRILDEGKNIGIFLSSAIETPQLHFVGKTETCCGEKVFLPALFPDLASATTALQLYGKELADWSCKQRDGSDIMMPLLCMPSSTMNITLEEFTKLGFAENFSESRPN